MKLTENFSLSEMIKSETALRLDLPNDPDFQINYKEKFKKKYFRGLQNRLI